jgi:hypothetical protein
MSNRTGLERMAAQAFPTDDELRAMAPDHERAHGPHRIMREQRLRTAVPGRGPGHRRWAPIAVVGVAVTAVLAAIAVFVLPGPVGDGPLTGTADQVPPAPAMTAQPATTLEQLAERAAAQPPVADGPFDYVHVRGIYPVTYLHPDGTGTVEGDEVRDRESWTSDDGTGRALDSYPDLGQEYDWGPDDESPRLDLPTDLVALEDVVVSESWNPLRTPTLYFAMERVWSTQVVQPPVQAAMLRLLASKPEVRVVGPTTDRLDRPGLAVEVTETGEIRGDAVDKRRAVIEHTMIFDQQTGGLLGYEAVLLEGGEFPGPHPLSRGHILLLEATRVGSLEERP